ncbi:type IV toxin-antitoxin system AbiEi family antitoxin domain-containing protein [Novosphingobium sp.]|jgi:hypothetical protein|uniref:type IV toxin-antitoxin system AbiEi family antitoxin domain-containing protein n=1 Tax=Novosphingobium sp. TaxID=1874826 RepID=UPI002FE2E598
MLRYNVRPRSPISASDAALSLEIRASAKAGEKAAGNALVTFGSLAFRERQIVVILRSLLHPADPVRSSDNEMRAKLSGSLREAFEWLAREAIAHSIVVFAPGAPFVSLDENTIIHRISALQRPSLSGNWRLANPLQLAMKACAEGLKSDARRLPARAILLERDTSANPSLRIEYSGKRPLAPACDNYLPRRQKLWDGASEPPTGSLRAKALEIVRRHQLASTAQFLAVGITHQYLSSLHRQGFVERIGHGVYRYPRRLEAPGTPKM